MSATWAVQAAIVTRLRADATLAGLSLTSDTTTVEIYNDVPENALFPHVLLSKPTETPDHTFGGTTLGIGWKNIIRVHTYSRYQGDKEAQQIRGRIVAVLNYQLLSVTGWPTVTVKYESGRTLIEDIDKIETRHDVAEFCVEVQ
jgi:Protein of unknown function (DUF3168)